MCLSFLATEQCDRYPVILCHIREEDPLREFTDLKIQADGLVYSKDLRAGGTAVGFNPTTGAFVALNNLHEPLLIGETISRGELVLSILNGGDPKEILESGNFNPFHIFYGNINQPDEVTYFQHPNRCSDQLPVSSISQHHPQKARGRMICLENDRLGESNRLKEACKMFESECARVKNMDDLDFWELIPWSRSPFKTPRGVEISSNSQTIIYCDNYLKLAVVKFRRISWLPNVSDSYYFQVGEWIKLSFPLEA